MAPDTVSRLGDACDEIVALETPVGFYAVGAHYADFPQLTDSEVTELLARG
jgi:predicted phosphoribosyltransferase